MHDVGAFAASFVPRPADFARLDPRFRLPVATLDAVPHYADWGFVVFQLRATTGSAKAHAMAFDFPTRRERALFFPTLHVHDGRVHARAEFDHTLYAQGVAAPGDLGWWEAGLPLGRTVDVARAGGLVDGDATVASMGLGGMRENADVWAALA